MKCIVLAAGYATRLYPLTKTTPKPLLKLAGKPILDYLIDNLLKVDELSEIVVVSNHKHIKNYQEWVKTAPNNKKISILDDGSTDNETRRGAVNDIIFALDEIKIDEDILVIAGDNVPTFSFCDFCNYAKEKQASSIMYEVCDDIEVLKRCGNAKLDENELVTYMVEKPENPPSNNVALPFYYYMKKDLQLIRQAQKEGCGTDAPGSLPAYLCEVTKIYAMKMPSETYDVADLESYKVISKIFEENNPFNLK